MNTQLCWLSFQSVHFKIDSHFSLLPAYILLIAYKNDKVFSLSITDVCGLTARGLPHVLFMGYPSRSIPTGGWWAGQDNAILTEPTSSHENGPKTRRVPAVRCII